jgi:hypothetical protein
MGRCVRILLLATVLAGCVPERAPAPRALSPAQARALVERSLPANLPDRGGWTDDIYSAFTYLGLTPSAQNSCAVSAVIAQESGYQVNPVIPGLAAMASREIDRRAQQSLVPLAVVHGALGWKSADGHSWNERIEAARTEKDLSDIYEEFIGSVPLGKTLFENRNPIRTRGPMQVNVAFAERFSATHQYPYPVRTSIADELFTRRGSIYFGVAHLLAYRAPYDSYLYRFADFNAGQFSSRNAAFQRAVADAAHMQLVADGALLPHEGMISAMGSTESAIRDLSLRLDLDHDAIHAALGQERTEAFEGTAVYRRTFALAEQETGRSLPRAVIPSIELQGPKLSRHLTTDWYAHRVDDRYQHCLMLQ